MNPETSPGIAIRRAATLRIFCATILVAAGIGTATAPSGSAATALGGIDISGACADQWPGTVARLVSNNVYGWRCRVYYSVGWRDFGVDLNRACRTQYGRSNAYAKYGNYNDPYSWRCYR